MRIKEVKDYSAPTLHEVLHHPIVGSVLALIRVLRGRWLEEGAYPGSWDQFCRAFESVALNIAEGLGRPIGQRPFFFGVARASAYEAAVAARIIGIDENLVEAVDSLARACEGLLPLEGEYPKWRAEPGNRDDKKA